MPLYIPQPKNAVIRGKNVSAKLCWNSNFSKNSTERFSEAQKYVDRNCINRMDKYTPEKNGELKRAVERGSIIGSGRLFYPEPHGRYQYYGVIYGPNIPIIENGEIKGWWSPKKKHSTGRYMQYDKTYATSPQRLWFEVMKKKNGSAILRDAAAIAGGKPSK